MFSINKGRSATLYGQFTPKELSDKVQLHLMPFHFTIKKKLRYRYGEVFGVLVIDLSPPQSPASEAESLRYDFVRR